MFKKVAATLALTALLAYSAVTYPYPQAKNYGNSTINVTASNASADLKSKFTSFLSGFYETGNCFGTNDCARIKFDNTSQTVSEGIAYGMIMMVYFSDNSTSYQDNFDKLWRYYQKWVNERGLMRWKIQGFSSKIEDNAASDADFDVGVALVMAHYQFGSTASKNYLDTAKALISKIRAYEISSGSNLHKPGDVWEETRNPSYISPAAWEIFKEVEYLSTAKDLWTDVISANYSLLTKNQNSSSPSGLFSDWCDDNGKPQNAPDGKGAGYSYDAARVPWRLAWANAWYGHSSAKTLLENVYSKFLNNKTASNLGVGDNNSAFLGPFVNAFSYSSSNQSKMNDFWSALMSKNGEPYFSAALQLLTGLLATGNMPNLKKLAGDNCCTTSPTVTGPQIDKFDKAESESVADRNFARTWEPWYVFTDAAEPGKSTIKNSRYESIVYNKKTGQCDTINDYNVIVKDGNDWVAKLENFELDNDTTKGGFAYAYVTIGLDAVNNGTAYDLSKCKDGFKYSYKGAAHKFKAQLSTVKDYDYHSSSVTRSSDTWKEVEVPMSGFKQGAWGVPVTFDPKLIEAFSWEVNLEVSSSKTGSLAIKDFFCLGGDLTFPENKPESKCGSNGTSSSSKGSSSSVSGSNSSSSKGSSSSVGSSSSSGNSSSSSSFSSSSSSSSSKSSSSRSSSSISSSSSSDDGDPNPIIYISRHSASNGAIAIKNGVNLQVLQNANVEIFGLNGKSVRKHEFSSGSYSIMLGDLPKGLYIVKVQFGSQGEILRVPVR